MKKARREQIVMAYVLTTRGTLPNDLEALLRTMRERIGADITEGEVRSAIRQTLRKARRQDRLAALVEP
jgi:hypothetical protein